MKIVNIMKKDFEQNIMIFQWQADELFADAKGRRKFILMLDPGACSWTIQTKTISDFAHPISYLNNILQKKMRLLKENIFIPNSRPQIANKTLRSFRPKCLNLYPGS